MLHMQDLASNTGSSGCFFTATLRLPIDITKFQVLVRAEHPIILIALADAFRLPVEVIVAFSVRQLSDENAFDGLFLYRETQRCRRVGVTWTVSAWLLAMLVKCSGISMTASPLLR